MLATATTTHAWTLNTGLVMLVCNLLVIFIAGFGIKYRGYGPQLPVELPVPLKGFGVADLLACTCLGHVVGTGMILGLRAAGGL